MKPRRGERGIAPERAFDALPDDSNVLASQIVQVSTDAKRRPIITALTMMSADMNMPHGERSRGSCPGAVSVADGAAAFPCGWAASPAAGA